MVRFDSKEARLTHEQLLGIYRLWHWRPIPRPRLDLGVLMTNEQLLAIYLRESTLDYLDYERDMLLDFAQWLDRRPERENERLPVGSAAEPSAPLPEHVHSWDGDQCHYCHIPRSPAAEPGVTLSPDGTQLGRWKPLSLDDDPAEESAAECMGCDMGLPLSGFEHIGQNGEPVGVCERVRAQSKSVTAEQIPVHIDATCKTPEPTHCNSCGVTLGQGQAIVSHTPECQHPLVLAIRAGWKLSMIMDIDQMVAGCPKHGPFEEGSRVSFLIDVECACPKKSGEQP